MTALKIPFRQELERYLLDIIYADIIRIDYLPQDDDLAQRVRQTFDLREVVVVRGDQNRHLYSDISCWVKQPDSISKRTFVKV